MRTWQQDYPVLALPFFLSAIVFASPLSYSRELREAVLNLCVTPLLTLEQATSLQQWWAQSSIAQEVAVGLLISLNATIPFLLIVFGLFDLMHRTVRFKKVTQLKDITDQFKGR